jgi:MarR family transcriptional regulator, organic hydroperoxide resistance regulator
MGLLVAQQCTSGQVKAVPEGPPDRECRRTTGVILVWNSCPTTRLLANRSYTILRAAWGGLHDAHSPRGDDGKLITMDTGPDDALRAPDLEGVDELSLGVYEAWGRTLHLQRQLAMRILPEKHLHPGQARCLWAISTNDGISQRDLADQLHLARPTVSIMLQSLEKSGLIEKSSHPDDQRLTRLRLTEAGHMLDARLREFHREYINDTIGAMSEQDRIEFERLLGVLRENIERAIERKDGEHA